MFEVLPRCEDRGTRCEVNVGWSEIADTLVVILGAIEIDEVQESRFELAGQVVILQINCAARRASSGVTHRGGLRWMLGLPAKPPNTTRISGASRWIGRPL
jgi:hypothetical protein